MFWIKPPAIFSQLFHEAVWKVHTSENVVYLTFDDGPHPVLTPFILDQLKSLGFTATFFCTGEMAEKYPELISRIKEEGHAIGNHTYSHMNGWEHKTQDFLEDIEKADELLHSNLLRPPYGRLKWQQWKKLRDRYRLVFWSLMPEDFLPNIGPDKLLHRLKHQVEPGQIVVLHENDKSMDNVMAILPQYLHFLHSRGFSVKCLEYAY